jgi:5'-3' exonuclease
VGNDFLPHLPSLEIREGAIDVRMAFRHQCTPTPFFLPHLPHAPARVQTLIDIYKSLFSQLGGYITDMTRDEDVGFFDFFISAMFPS